MSEEALVKYCSPTLAGIKTGSLFSCSYHSQAELSAFLRTWNIALRGKGIRIIPLRTHLIRRLSRSEDFPHEIGLFLGYPCEDVRGFIDNKAACAKCVGCWKVYGDEEKAKKQFERFKKCTRIYQQQWADGKPLTRLTVAR